MQGAFQHGVASGDPRADAVVLWTRVTSAESEVPVRWTLARDPELSDVVAAGEASASAEDDHTVHVDVGELEPATSYHYGFQAAGERSPVARTRTLPGAGATRARFATCSCAKFNAGFFNAYARIAERDDLDFLLHLGDYIYEAANKPAKGQTPGADIGRPFEPDGECRTLAEYRTRYEQYHRDPDVQALHRALPLICALDDHELADGAWAGGSDAHDPEVHGPWSERRDAAFRARWEWLPARPPDPADPTRVFRRVDVGAAAAILICDIRSRRSQPALLPDAADPGRSMLGAEQRDWLYGELDRPAPAWRLVASPSILHKTWADELTEPLRTALVKLKLIDEDGEGPDEDQWDGYPVERRALLDRLRRAGDVAVLSADIHVSIASRLQYEQVPFALEVTAPSLTSQNLDEKLGVEAGGPELRAAEDAMVAGLEQVLWCELAGHGYCVIDVDPERLRAEWWLVDGVLEPLAGQTMAAAFELDRGSGKPRRVA
jgi:phosphodiesterase/alkaline phosphatase D-like protein